MLGFLDGILGDTKRVALLVDGPNLLREEFDVNFEDVRTVSEPDVARVYLDNRASSGLIEAVETNGMEPVVTSGDVDVRLAVDATAYALEGFDIVIATRDADFKPALERANAEGARTTVVGVSDCFSAALESVADEVVFLD
ncbi:MAG: NYN domain-containing protein [Halobacteriales archaeon]|nr:NYN domain-containing protein [Halobacteriales archaeon]